MTDIGISHIMATKTANKFYLQRDSNEEWSKSNITSPAFMSRWVLWGSKSTAAAVRNVNANCKDLHFKLK